MELTTVYIWGSLGAAFCLYVGVLIGHCLHERDFAATIKFQADTHNVWCANHNVERELLIDEQYAREEKLIASHNEVLREMEISLLLAGQAVEGIENDLKKMESQWKYADNFRKSIVQAMFDSNLWNFAEHDANPALMLQMLFAFHQEVAIDPKQNQRAKNLYVKGVRAGAKKGREQMQKLMQKSIDNQATAITDMGVALSRAHNSIRINRMAVHNTLTDKVGLVGVRRAIVQGIAAECTRLRAVEAKKGE